MEKSCREKQMEILKGRYTEISLKDYKGEFVLIEGYDELIPSDEDSIAQFCSQEDIAMDDVIIYGMRKEEVKTDLVEDLRITLVENHAVDESEFEDNKEYFESIEKQVDNFVKKFKSGFFEQDKTIIKID